MKIRLFNSQTSLTLEMENVVYWICFASGCIEDGNGTLAKSFNRNELIGIPPKNVGNVKLI